MPANSMAKPSGPVAFPLLKPFIASDSSSIHKHVSRSVLASSGNVGRWSLSKNYFCFSELFSDLYLYKSS